MMLRSSRRALRLLQPLFVGLAVVLLSPAASARGPGDEAIPGQGGSLSAAEAQTVEVTADTWRAVQAKLDDVYTHAEVSQLRDAAVETFVRQMSAADRGDTWDSRKAARDAARNDLVRELAKLVELRSQLEDRDAKLEAGLAVAELMLRVGNFASAMNSAKAQLKHDLPPARKAQTYRVWIAAARGANDAEAMKQAEQQFKDELPAEAESTFGPALPFGPVRLAVQQFEYAQAQDDFALRHSSAREVVEGAVKLRDKAREAAAQVLATRRHGQ
jgi:hypothetical protein